METLCVDHCIPIQGKGKCKKIAFLLDSLSQFWRFSIFGSGTIFPPFSSFFPTGEFLQNSMTAYEMKWLRIYIGKEFRHVSAITKRSRGFLSWKPHSWTNATHKNQNSIVSIIKGLSTLTPKNMDIKCFAVDGQNAPCYVGIFWLPEVLVADKNMRFISIRLTFFGQKKRAAKTSGFWKTNWNVWKIIWWTDSFLRDESFSIAKAIFCHLVWENKTFSVFKKCFL